MRRKEEKRGGFDTLSGGCHGYPTSLYYILLILGGSRGGAEVLPTICCRKEDVAWPKSGLYVIIYIDLHGQKHRRCEHNGNRSQLSKKVCLRPILRGREKPREGFRG